MRLPSKWLILIALIANGVAFYWFDLQRQQRGAQAGIASVGTIRDREPGGTQLVLLSELNPAAEVKRGKPAEKIGHQETVAAESGTGDIDAARTPERTRVGRPGNNPAAPPGRIPRGGTCWSLGPFAVATEAAQLARELIAEGVQARVRIQGGKAKPRIWVYLPPPISAAALAAELRGLRAKGIDHFVFSDGELKGGISLGLYIALDDAEKWQKTLAFRGYDAKIHIASNIQAVWIDFMEENGKALAEKAAVKRTETSPRLRIEESACAQSPFLSTVKAPIAR